MEKHRFFSILVAVFLVVVLVLPSSLVVSAQEEPTEEPTVELTEEPTAEPTEEPTAEPTEEPTAEPTEEPTAEPTEEPTVEPTEEPTEEPTVEPTEEPTEEPTAEPTEEPTEEPTVEPTEEPTEEPTVEPTEEPTEEPTVEPTATVTPTVGAAGDVGAQAVVGSWTTEYIGIQNLGSSTEVALDLYQGSSTSVQTLGPTTVAQNANLLYTSSDLSDGRFSGIVTAGGPVAVAALNLNSIYKVGDIYLGHTAPSQRQTLPLIYRHHYNYTSKFHIQNAHSSAQDITVDTYLIGSSSADASHIYYGVPANSSFTVDFANDSNYDGFGSGNEHYGYAVVTGSAGNMAVVCESIKDDGDVDLQTYYNGLSDDVAGRDLIAPLVYNQHVDWKSGITVVNMSSTPTTVEMTYVSKGQGTGTASVYIDGNSSGLFYMPWYSPAYSYGTVLFHSTASDILAVVNTVKYRNGAVGSATPAMNPSVATNKIALPLALNEGGNGWKVGINVYCVDACTVNSTWIRANSDPTNPSNRFTASDSASAGQVVMFYGPWYLPTGFTGAVYLESTGRMVAVTNFVSYNAGINAALPSHNYE